MLEHQRLTCTTPKQPHGRSVVSVVWIERPHRTENSAGTALIHPRVSAFISPAFFPGSMTTAHAPRDVVQMLVVEGSRGYARFRYDVLYTRGVISAFWMRRTAA
jgi:hypothetical protein